MGYQGPWARAFGSTEEEPDHSLVVYSQYPIPIGAMALSGTPTTGDQLESIARATNRTAILVGVMCVIFVLSYWIHPSYNYGGAGFTVSPLGPIPRFQEDDWVRVRFRGDISKGKVRGRRSGIDGYYYEVEVYGRGRYASGEFLQGISVEVPEYHLLKWEDNPDTTTAESSTVEPPKAEVAPEPTEEPAPEPVQEKKEYKPRQVGDTVKVLSGEHKGLTGVIMGKWERDGYHEYPVKVTRGDDFKLPSSVTVSDSDLEE